MEERELDKKRDFITRTEKKIILKFILCGDGNVGKTTLRKAYFGEQFNNEYMMTIGADFAVKHINEELSIQFWDLAGQDMFIAVRSTYYAGVNGALLLYDCTEPKSYDNVIKWLKELKKHSGSGLVPIVLVGNKIDLEENKCISKDKGQALANAISNILYDGKQNIPFFETSAHSGINIDLAIQTLIDLCFEHFSIDTESKN